MAEFDRITTRISADLTAEAIRRLKAEVAFLRRMGYPEAADELEALEMVVEIRLEEKQP